MSKFARDDSDSDTEQEVAKVEAPVEEEPAEDTSCANPSVMTKYQEAAKIANAALDAVAKACVLGATVVELIKIGEAIIAEKCAAIYRTKVKGKDVEKGVSFPICISINECVCHNCPLDNDTEGNDTVADGDMCKIDLGVHVDGYIAVVAHTVHVGLQASDVKGDLAAAYGAAFTAAKVAAGLIRPGNTNTQVTTAIKKVTEAYGVASICGTIMHQVKRFVMDGNKMILLRDEPEQKVVACTFEENEVFVVDIAMTTSEGKPKEKNQKPTVYKRVVERKYGLKIKNSRVFFSEVIRRFPTLPFSLRYIEDETAAKVGLRECLGHELILPYPILYEKKDSQIVHYKFTVMILPGGNTKITGVDFDLPEGIDTSEWDAKLPEDLQALVKAEKEQAAKKAAKKAKKAADKAAKAK